MYGGRSAGRKWKAMVEKLYRPIRETVFKSNVNSDLEVGRPGFILPLVIFLLFFFRLPRDEGWKEGDAFAAAKIFFF